LGRGAWRHDRWLRLQLDDGDLDQPAAREQLPETPSIEAKSARRLVLAAVMMATFMAAMESSIVATADDRRQAWRIPSVQLGICRLSVDPGGDDPDLWAPRRSLWAQPVFFAGAGLFLLVSTLCGLAWAMLPLVLFRALQGAGAGAIQPIAITIIGDIYRPTERARVQGYISGVFGVAAIIGPMLGAFPA
jgi:MFS family permease